MGGKATNVAPGCELRQKELVSRIVCLFPIPVIQFLQGGFYLGALLRQNLHANQNASKCRAVIAIVKHGYIPAPGQFGQKIKQSAGTLGELEPVDDLMLDTGWRMTSDHMAYMQLGHFIVSQVEHFVTFFL